MCVNGKEVRMFVQVKGIKVYYQNTLNANKLDNITSLDENPVEKRNAGTK